MKGNMLLKCLWWIYLCTVAACTTTSSSKHRLAYGSCFKHSRGFEDTRIMLKINEDKPDSFVWLGDFVYLDIKKLIPWTPFRTFTIDTNENIVKKFTDTYNEQNYTVLKRNNKTKIYGVWDDHDSGINDSGKDNPVKDFVRKLFLDAMDEPQDSPRRTRAGGMYEAYYLDPDRKIKLILLDGRYSRDELHSTDIPEDEKTSLGLEQELWLEQEMANSTAVITLIANGYQILPEDHPMIENFYPKSRAHLLNLLHKYPHTKYLLLSGDVHFAELLSDPCSKDLLGYTLNEVTTSGLTHSLGSALGEIAGIRLDFFFPETYSKAADRYMKENYAIIDFDITDTRKFSIDVQIKDIDGNIVMNRKWTQTHFGGDYNQTDSPITRQTRYAECRDRLSTVFSRRVRNLFSKCSEVHKPFLYMLIVAILFLRWLLLFVLGLIKRLLCRRKQPEAEKVKTG